jgi:hypothetical protein
MEERQIRLVTGEDVLLITPHGEVRIKIDDHGSMVWAWDDDQWKGPSGEYMMPKPGLIDIKGEEVLYFVLTHKHHLCTWNDVRPDGIYCTTCGKKKEEKKACKNCGLVHKHEPFTDCFSEKTDGPLPDDLQEYYHNKFGEDNDE